MSMSDFSDPQQPFLVRPETSGWAKASLIFGLLSFCFSILAGIPAIIFGVIGLSQANNSQGRIGGQGLAIAGIITGSLGCLFLFIQIALLLPALQAVRESARRTQSAANLRQLSAGAMSYEAQHGVLPAAADSSKGPPVSWRLQLTPSLEANNVYQRYNFEEPWDGPSNVGLSRMDVPPFKNPNLTEPPGLTNYLALVGDETAFPPGQGARIPANSSMTVFFVEADEDRAVPWTKPQDIDFDPANPLDGLGNFRPGGFGASFRDGHTQVISDDVDPAVFRAMVTRTDEDDDIIY